MLLCIRYLHVFTRNNLNAFFTNHPLKLNPLDLANCDFVFGAVVKFGGPGRLMRSHLLGMLEPASILQVPGAAG